jgi:U4/U6.U5 tri-snRNP-associated protein 2
MKEYAYSFAAPPGTSTLYDLIGNVTLESVWLPGGDEKYVYKAQVKDFARDKWFVIQDLIVEELEKERMHLAESYIQVFPANSELWLILDLATSETRLIGSW